MTLWSLSFGNSPTSNLSRYLPRQRWQPYLRPVHTLQPQYEGHFKLFHSKLKILSPINHMDVDYLGIQNLSCKAPKNEIICSCPVFVSLSRKHSLGQPHLLHLE